MKYRVELSCAAYPLDKMCIDVNLDDNQFIEVSDERCGSGTIRYSGDARNYDFYLYENSAGIAGIDWKDQNFPAGELHILDERVVVGSNFQFLDSRERCHYKVTKITPFT
jgi:hypothetical protein